MNQLADNHQASKDAELAAARQPDAGPWCACGKFRVQVFTGVCPVCTDTTATEHKAAVAAIGRSPRWADSFRFGRKVDGE